MTEITAPKSAVTAEQFADEIREQLKYTQGVTVEQAKPADVYVAAAAAVRRHLVDSWMKTQADMVNGNTKAVGYLSAEFLMGKQLEHALLQSRAAQAGRMNTDSGRQLRADGHAGVQRGHRVLKYHGKQ